MNCVLLGRFNDDTTTNWRDQLDYAPVDDTLETLFQKLASQNTRIIHPWI